MASITPYKDGWRAQISVKPDPASKPVRDSQTFRTQREAKAWAAAREHELRKQAAQRPAERYTLRAMLERYDAEIIPAKRGARPESMRLRAFLRNFPMLADKTLADVTTPDLAEWRDARLRGFVGSDGQQVPAVGVASVLRDISWLRNAFSVARKEWRWMDANPFEGFRLPADAPPRDRRVSPLEVKLLCRQLGYRTGVPPQSLQQETALAFLIALRSAMRAGEILALGKGTLDLDQRVARVPHKTQHLTGRPREVPLTRQAVRLLSKAELVAGADYFTLCAVSHAIVVLACVPNRETTGRACEAPALRALRNFFLCCASLGSLRVSQRHVAVADCRIQTRISGKRAIHLRGVPAVRVFRDSILFHRDYLSVRYDGNNVT
ncbi:tyrosine-type recombinase/integrase [Burkholderia multivorans]|uniref:tyrosine-type recombinase/integrase n=1 Tax=Burkholderia multivorans TaxID=87883 RepID=UPI002019DBEC|nr:tyrosine-type recombinase/integrase [Burkholderia multivorans]MCO1361023.1 tyrosine-type recombinase/integrase [Burkholderia multivorans]MCO1420793.1 tyrosine-type recombinase/integrase [Burkholderia multivorans]UQO93358.1 tyrosine-type recombinase/integrase [Burkholderia multivorans]